LAEYHLQPPFSWILAWFTPSQDAQSSDPPPLRTAARPSFEPLQAIGFL
jgi:hypothetical protein